MSDLEISLIITVVLAVSAFIGKEIWDKNKRNQERIDKSVVDTVSDSKERLNKIDTILAIHTRDIDAIENDVMELKNSWKSSNEAMRALNSTIEKFDNNSRLQHQEMKVTLDNNTKAMHELLNSLKK